MFEHEDFERYEFENVPLDRDLYLVDQKYMSDYESMMTRFLTDYKNNPYENVGYVSYAAARKALDNSIELSWYVNIPDRFHEVSIILPREQFVSCVSCQACDEKPRIFVKGEWLDSLHARSFSVFSMIDAIGVKKYLEEDKLSTEMLAELRDRIDQIASEYPSISFISFADSLLLKSNWSVGAFNNDISYTYEPEVFIYLAEKISKIYQDCIGLPTYSVITQGQNSYYNDSLLHISESNNHVSLNSLGVPFAQLMDIEHTARHNIRSKQHAPAEVYMDSLYYHSLNFKHSFDKNSQPKAEYSTKMVSTSCEYFFNSCGELIEQLEK